MRAAIYTRVSSDEQVQHGVSLAMQERDCRERCARLGAEVAAVYRDEGLSGTDLDAQLDRLTELYLSGAMDVGTVERSARPIREERARLESAMVATAPVDVELWRRVERLGVEGLLVNIREGPLEGQAEFLRSVYQRVELLPGKRVVFHAPGLPPVERVLPRYYSEARGVTDIGF